MPQEVQALDVRLEMTIEEMKRVLTESVQDPQNACIIHLAAKTSVDDCEKNPHQAFQINVEGSLRLFQACQILNIRRFIYVSTAHVFAPPVTRNKLNFQSPLNPQNMYGRSKLLGEQVLRSHVSQKTTSLSIVRLFSLIGEDMQPHFLYPNLIRRALNNDYSPLPGFDNVRDFMDVQVVCQELVRLAQSQTFPREVLICSGQEKTVGQLAQQVFLAHGKDPNVLIAAPGRPSDIGYMVGEPTVYK